MTDGASGARRIRRWDVMRLSLVPDALTVSIAVATDILDGRCLTRRYKKSTGLMMGRCLIFFCL